MIRYKISLDADGPDSNLTSADQTCLPMLIKETTEVLESLIRKKDKKWLDLASKRIQKFKKAKKYDESKGIWGRIKSVYMAIQHSKCAYCERMRSPEELAVEHYRPKRGVEVWRPVTEEMKYDFPLGEDYPEGYYLLAYHPLNYLVACDRCNSKYKGNFFPIAGCRGSQSCDLNDYQNEQPYLVYPLGDVDQDPEGIIAFAGYLPVAKQSSGYNYHRAIVMIELLGLDAEDLLLERAKAICIFYSALQNIESSDISQHKNAQHDVKLMLSDRWEFAGCLRSFYELYKHDRKQASKFAQAAREYRDSLVTCEGVVLENFEENCNQRGEQN